MVYLAGVWTLWLRQLDGDCLPSLCHLPEHDVYTNGERDPDFSSGPSRDPFPGDISKPFLSLFPVSGRFPFTGELVISHHIYCQPGTGPPPTFFQLLASQEPSPGFLCLRNKCRPAGARTCPSLPIPPTSLAPQGGVQMHNQHMGWGLQKWAGKGRHGFRFRPGEPAV